MKAWLSRIVFVACMTLVGVLSLSVLGNAAEFSADMTMRDEEGVSTGRVYIKGEMSRTELDIDGEMTVTILRLDLKTAWTLLPEAVYIEMPIPMDATRPTNDDYDEVDLGVETVGGYACDVVRYVYRDKSLGSLTHWIARGLGYPMRMVAYAPDGTVTMTIEYTNITQGGLSASLFEVPPGYTRMTIPFAIPGMPGMPGLP